MAEYEAKIYDVEEIPGNDSLVAGGNVETGHILISTAGEYKRGEVLMSSGDSFVKATSGGISTATELCILCQDITLEEEEMSDEWVYFAGRFNAESLVYDESIDASELESAMRKHGIYMR